MRTSTRAIAAGIFAFATALFAAPSEAGELRGIIRNNQGVQRFGKGKTVEAYDRFGDALVDLPFSGEVHYNLGNSFLVNKEFEKALSEYRQAVKLSPGDSDRAKRTRFQALFNSAIALTELKKTEEALMSYQEALEIDPKSIEAKTNMELLASQAGGGEGEGDKQQQQDKGDKKDDKSEGQGEGDQEKQPPPPQPNQGQKPKEKPKPKPFDSKEMSEQDVGRILEELKRQEEQIRAKFQREGGKDAPPDKDW